MSIDFNTLETSKTASNSPERLLDRPIEPVATFSTGRKPGYLLDVILVLVSLAGLALSVYSVQKLQNNPNRPEVIIECPPKMIENLEKLDQKINEINAN